MDWLAANWSHVLELSREHLMLSVPAIFVSTLIAIPIGRAAYKHPRIGGVLLQTSALLYSIPALPLLIIIPILFGTPLRSRTTVIIALSMYGTALLVHTAAGAFRSVDNSVRDAAIAIGNSQRNIFWRIDLPLALPVLFAGLRVLSVSTIGLVTIGALIGVHSLGSLLTDGFQRGIYAEVITGLVATVVIALLLDAALVILERILTPWQLVGKAVKQ
ncbi:ABC transporter permease subunit [Canibacter sp. lx-72]|uniref:ABC transporter permease n=1 Tax=Canibacter zhuwentaonis TaxID=2837491 RepID=UPI001BDD0180|nr:ABC transporter permease subunit [Canibacter zhuwentaonis]MBT1017967.1 ABC transporter permease subunit [Canibacter zhuwentaonis]